MGITWVNINFNSSTLALSKNINSKFDQSWIYELLLKSGLSWDFISRLIVKGDVVCALSFQN
jgi:hypothetical protein